MTDLGCQSLTHGREGQERCVFSGLKRPEPASANLPFGAAMMPKSQPGDSGGGVVVRILLKILGGLVVVLVVAIAGAAAFAQFGSERKMHRTVRVDVTPIAISTDQAALDRGGYLYKSQGCADCHGDDGAGKVVVNDGGLFVKTPHISPGQGSVTSGYKPEDWVRTIRQGVKPDGQPVFIMPSEDFNRLTDADVGAIVAYMRAMPAVQGAPGEIR